MQGESEKNKMVSGQLYHSNDPILIHDRRNAVNKTRFFNNLLSDQAIERLEILKQLFGSCHSDADIIAPFFCDYGYNIHIGHHFYANTNCVFLDCAEIRIGNYVFLGPQVQLYTATHPLDPDLRRQGLESAKPITIEDDVWIGGSAIINAGVTIGRGTTIGSGSVVTHDIPANVVAVGNPCKVLCQLK